MSKTLYSTSYRGITRHQTPRTTSAHPGSRQGNMEVDHPALLLKTNRSQNPQQNSNWPTPHPQSHSRLVLKAYIFIWHDLLTSKVLTENEFGFYIWTWIAHLSFTVHSIFSFPDIYHQDCVKVSQSCLALCDSMERYSLPGSSVHGDLHARILERVAVLFSRGSSQPRDRTQVSHIAGGFFTIWATREASSRLRWAKNVSVLHDEM